MGHSARQLGRTEQRIVHLYPAERLEMNPGEAQALDFVTWVPTAPAIRSDHKFRLALRAPIHCVKSKDRRSLFFPARPERGPQRHRGELDEPGGGEECGRVSQVRKPVFDAQVGCQHDFETWHGEKGKKPGGICARIVDEVVRVTFRTGAWCLAPPSIAFWCMHRLFEFERVTAVGERCLLGERPFTDFKDLHGTRCVQACAGPQGDASPGDGRGARRITLNRCYRGETRISQPRARDVTEYARFAWHSIWS